MCKNGSVSLLLYSLCCIFFLLYDSRFYLCKEIIKRTKVFCFNQQKSFSSWNASRQAQALVFITYLPNSQWSKAIFSQVAYANKDLKATVIVDMATLTGAQGVATGQYHGAIVTNDENYEGACVKAGRWSGDLTVKRSENYFQRFKLKYLYRFTIPYYGHPWDHFYSP